MQMFSIAASKEFKFTDFPVFGFPAINYGNRPKLGAKEMVTITWVNFIGKSRFLHITITMTKVTQ